MAQPDVVPSWYLKKWAVKCTALRCEANGHFPDHAPILSQDKHLRLLRQTVMQQQC